MAVAVRDTIDEDVLVKQAEAFDRRAERLRAEARSLAQQAIDLRLEIDRQRRAPVRVLRPRARGPRVGAARDARLLAETTALLDQIGPCTSTVLAERLHLSRQQIHHV